jgi:hypothetical protein
MQAIDLTGQRFGRLLVQARGMSGSHGSVYWSCICDCGKTKTIRGDVLRGGISQSCGCLCKERAAEWRKAAAGKGVYKPQLKAMDTLEWDGKSFPDISKNRSVSFPGINIPASPEQIAWMAGIYDGEGSVITPKTRSERGGRQTTPLRISIQMTDRDVLENFRSFAGGGHIHSKKELPGRKQIFVYQTQGPRAFVLFQKIWPWLCSRRRGQVGSAILKWGMMRTSAEGILLTKEKVEEIKIKLRKSKYGLPPALAREYGVSKSTIFGIKAGRSWRDAPRNS